eukprot:jgi/Psemu1/57705/gm1.57705_g
MITLICCAKRISKDVDILQLQMSLDIYGPSSVVSVSLNRNNTSLGFIFHNRVTTPAILNCYTHTPEASIARWQSCFCNGNICAINNEQILTIMQLTTCIAELQQQKQKTCYISIAHEDFANFHTATGIPQLHFDQLKAIAHHLHNIKYGDSPINDDALAQEIFADPMPRPSPTRNKQGGLAVTLAHLTPMPAGLMLVVFMMLLRKSFVASVCIYIVVEFIGDEGINGG